MVKIIGAEDCENAPKKKLLKDFNIAYANNDVEFIMENITDNVIWSIIGDKHMEGKAQIGEVLKQMRNFTPAELHIHNIITHGNTGAVNGMLKLDNQARFAFCDVYMFSSAAKNAKIKAITSYVIELSQEL